MRRSHVKSRTGCSQCKARRIKCNELRPQCSHCVRRSDKCNIALTDGIFFHSRPEAKLAAPILPLNEQRFIAQSIETSQVSNIAFEELELLHHYTTTTCHSLNNRPRDTEIWRITAPQLALEFPCLMHAIFAVSALHLGKLQPPKEKHWAKIAFEHEALALPSLRSAAANPNKDTAHVIFALSAFVVPYACASVPGCEDSARDSTSGILPRWFLLIRGVGEFVFQTRQWLQGGPLSVMLRSTEYTVDYTRNPDDEHLATLLPLLSKSMRTGAAQEVHLLHCRHALDQLRQLFSLLLTPCDIVVDKSAALIWPMCVSSEYVQLVQQSVPEALIVLAYYCTLLKRAESAWYLQCQASRLLQIVERKLDDTWSIWLEWPRRCLATTLD